MSNLFAKLLQKVKTTGEHLEITCAADWNRVPNGFFKTKDGLGYKSGSTVMHPVGDTVVDGGRRVSLDPAQELPQVTFNYQIKQGVRRVNGTTLLDSDVLDSDSGDARYEGDRPFVGVDKGLW